MVCQLQAQSKSVESWIYSKIYNNWTIAVINNTEYKNHNLKHVRPNILLNNNWTALSCARRFVAFSRSNFVYYPFVANDDSRSFKQFL